MPSTAVPAMAPAAFTSFDVAIWFMERARADDSYLQPRKLQSIMFMAQGHYAAANRGRRLMPSIFVFDEGGPLDPNIFRAFEHGRPTVTQTQLSAPVTRFLEAIWRRYADCDALRLDQIVARRGAAETAIQNRDGSEITLAAMVRMFSREAAAGSTAPPAASATPAPYVPQVLRTHTGRPVTVQKWAPGKKAPAV
ncbi:MAG: hypothetical protein GEU92_04045 [Alphaproteobacteria bacterium]|nr:hypothetical protein [Alphaproteobacteria bacterium]